MFYFVGVEKKLFDDVKIFMLRGNGSVVVLKQYNNVLKGKVDYFLVNVCELDGSSKIISLIRFSEVEYLMDIDGVEVDDENEENDLSKGKKII